MRDSKRHAFSLVELSIVLVILGLLTGGILAGQSLIRAAELSSFASAYDRYRAATNTFRDKYFALPGDMSNATSFWGSLGGTGSDSVCQSIAATGLPTCNGDGDGTLISTSGVSTAEFARFWQHLANAGLIEGKYNGLFGSVSGLNVPSTKIPSIYWRMNALSSALPSTAFSFAVPQSPAHLVLQNSAASFVGFTPSEAWNIDTKLDDGLPATGILMVNKGDGATNFCSTVGGGWLVMQALLTRFPTKTSNVFLST